MILKKVASAAVVGVVSYTVGALLLTGLIASTLALETAEARRKKR
jgi:hypothetical protein